jgi:threonylcarbamoyladenosine tRNA methylthiotransferase MtaB
MKKIAFHTFGCKLNFAETSTITRDFKNENFKIVDFKDVADIYVIHSCIVTQNAEKKCIASIKQSKKKNPDAKIAVIGCMSELNKERLEDLGIVNLILGNTDKYALLDFIESSEKSTDTKPEAFVSSFSVEERTRSFIKIQDGCDYFCSYCTIPFARGRSRSDTIDNIVRIAREIADAGVKEIVLTGVNIGDFGKRHNETFVALLQKLDKEVNISRIRFSSIEPDLCTDEIIDFVAKSSKFLPHFHIPLQSGSDKVLKLMNRKYNRELFSDKLKRIKSLMPDCCIATDLIVGFPGETDSDFLDTYNFIKDSELSYVHVFTYSERNNTRSSKMDSPVQDFVRKQRSEKLHKLSDEKKLFFYKNNLGKIRKVLFESNISDGMIHGFTDNYIKVQTEFKKELINQIFDIELTKVTNELVCDCRIIYS